MRGFEFRFDRDFRSLLERVAEGGEILLAGPYLGAEILSGLPIRRVLTDVNAWTAVEPNPEAAFTWLLSGAAEFRHTPKLHAKIALGRDAALVGSANFTVSGLGAEGNIEAGFLVTDPLALATIRAEYDRWWASAAREAVDTQKLVQRWRETPPSRSTPVKPSFAIPYLPAPKEKEPLHLDADGERLLTRLRRFPSSTEAEAYINLEIKLLKRLGIAPDDPRIVATVPKSSEALALNINGRWVLRAAFDRNEVRYGAMVALGTSRRHRSQPDFLFSMETGAEFLGFSDLEAFRGDPDLQKNWEAACRDESEARAGGPLARHRSEAHTRLLADPSFRRAVFARLDVPLAGLVYWTAEEAQVAGKEQSFRFYSRQPNLRTRLPIGSHLWLATYLPGEDGRAILTITAAFHIIGHGEESGETVLFADTETSRYFDLGGNDATSAIADALGEQDALPAGKLRHHFRSLRTISAEADERFQHMMSSAPPAVRSEV